METLMKICSNATQIVTLTILLLFTHLHLRSNPLPLKSLPQFSIQPVLLLFFGLTREEVTADGVDSRDQS